MTSDVRARLGYVSRMEQEDEEKKHWRIGNDGDERVTG